MSMNSIVADSLARIKNAQQRGFQYVLLKSSKMVRAVISVMLKEGYIAGFDKVLDEKGFELLKVDLKYYSGKPVIQSVKMLSKPGRRVYCSAADMPKSYNGMGIVIVSTSKGVISDDEATKIGVGGELICEVY